MNLTSISLLFGVGDTGDISSQRSAEHERGDLWFGRRQPCMAYSMGDESAAHPIEVLTLLVAEKAGLIADGLGADLSEVFRELLPMIQSGAAGEEES